MALTLNSATVRAALDPRLLEKDLSDSVIALSIYSGAAKSEILRRFPTADQASGDDETNLNAAWALLTAAEIAPVLPRLVQVNFGIGAGGYRRNEINTDDLVSELRSKAERHLGNVVNVSEVEVELRIPTVFGRASGRRGK